MEFYGHHTSPEEEEENIEKFISDLKNLFEKKSMIPKGLKINQYSEIDKDFMNAMHNSNFSEEEVKILNLIKKIDLSYFKLYKYNPRIVHLLCDIIIVFMYLKDKNIHKHHYKGVKWIVLGFLLFILFLFLIKGYIKE